MGVVIPYYGGKADLDINERREATQLELQQEYRIIQLEAALSNLIEIASDRWESFPSNALDEANTVLNDNN